MYEYIKSRNAADRMVVTPVITRTVAVRLIFSDVIQEGCTTSGVLLRHGGITFVKPGMKENF
jgi:hypothetical protein